MRSPRDGIQTDRSEKKVADNQRNLFALIGPSLYRPLFLLTQPLNMIRHLFSAAAIFVAATSLSHAQAGPQVVKITGINASLEKSPEFTFSIGPQRKSTSQDWLWVEVSFQCRVPGPNPVLPEVAFNYYILLNNPTPQNRTGTLLTGTVTHTGVTSGTDEHHSVMLVSPQTLKGLFAGKGPSSISQAVQAIGVTATVQGQLQDELSNLKGKGKKQWWAQLQQGPAGLVLSKDQTPFAPLFYDYFEAIKTKTGN